jgi:hypothetical protein
MKIATIHLTKSDSNRPFVRAAAYRTHGIGTRLVDLTERVRTQLYKDNKYPKHQASRLRTAQQNASVAVTTRTIPSETAAPAPVRRNEVPPPLRQDNRVC